MTFSDNVYIDLGEQENLGITYVALSRNMYFKKMMIQDMTEERFKK